MRPQLPTADNLLPYLRRIDEARYYSNHGPLLSEFEGRLAALYSVDPAEAALAANGTVALSALLLAVGAKPGSTCLLPSWTFVGSAAAVWAANLVPHFIDVSRDTWMLDPDALVDRDLTGVGAVMVVSPFGAPVNTAHWDRFTEVTGIPVVIDCAGAFDTVASVDQAKPGLSPIMVSLHATKAFGTGEGAVVLSRDERTMHRFRQICNFGVWATPAQVLGYNGKLSEYHCAVGLAMLDMWVDRRKALERLTARYRAAIGEMPAIGLLPGYGDGWVSCYCNVITIEPAVSTMDRLRTAGVETRRWWRFGVHLEQAYAAFPRDPLPITEHLASRVFGLPFYHDLSDTEMALVISTLANMYANSAP